MTSFPSSLQPPSLPYSSPPFDREGGGGRRREEEEEGGREGEARRDAHLMWAVVVKRRKERERGEEGERGKKKGRERDLNRYHFSFVVWPATL